MKPKVSVATTTYNHEQYIAQTILSVASQQTNFPFEMVIGEDCSTDNTREIAIELKAMYPEIIRLLLREENWGRRRNFLDTLQACQGEYIALLEGDDYWTSPRKLQKQADYLDSHPGCALCFHPVIAEYENSDRPPELFQPAISKHIYTIEDLIERNFIATCSVMFRNKLVNPLPQWFQDVPAADWPLNILNAQYGDIGYLPEPMGAYRVHGRGAWTSKSETQKLQKNIETREIVKEHFKTQYRHNFDRGIARVHLRLLKALLTNRDISGAVRHTRNILFRRRVSIYALLTLPWGWLYAKTRNFFGTIISLSDQ